MRRFRLLTAAAAICVVAMLAGCKDRETQVQRLISQLESSDVTDRTEAAKSLGEMGSAAKAKTAVPALEAIVEDESDRSPDDWHAWYQASVALSRIAHIENEATALAETQAFLEGGGDAAGVDGLFRMDAAERAGHVSVVELLLANGGRIGVPEGMESPPMNDAVLGAVNSGKTDILELLLRQGADVNARRALGDGGRGLTPLHEAARYGDVKIVRFLLAHGADVNAEAGDGVTPLCIAAGAGYGDAARTLIEHGAKVSVDPQTGTGPLHWAASGRLRVVDLLIDADPGFWLYGVSPAIGVAPFANTSAVTRLLVKQGAEVHRSRSGGEAPIVVAAAFCNLPALRVLLEYGAEVNTVGQEGWTPLHLAILGSDSEMVKTLLQHGADVDAVASSLPSRLPEIDNDDEEGYSAMEMAYRMVVFGERAAPNHRRRGLGARSNLKEYEDILDGQKRCIEIIRLLLEHGAKSPPQDQD
ncbi:MAG: ankyrin repeat domain-containing protein [Planctomycetota bacterium]|jgi:ankyrin repeat protein